MDRTREVHVHVNWTVDARTQNCDETFTLTAHGEEAFFSELNRVAVTVLAPASPQRDK
jgi:hypothetical protein